MESTDFEITSHHRTVTELVSSTKRALSTAETEGSISDWLKAIETSIKVNDYAGKEMVRSRLRRHLLEAANVLAGTYAGCEEVELGEWASGATEDTLGNRAQEFLNLHKSLFA